MKKKFDSFVKRYFSIIVIGIIALTVFAIYSNTLNASFHLDDHFYIKNNETIKDLGSFSEFKMWTNVNKRPLSTLTFAINYNIHGFELPPYHLVNILIHLLTGMVVYFLSKLILKHSIFLSEEEATKCQYVSAFIAIIYISHPIQTQSVNYIVQRMTLMSALFYFLSVLTYFMGRLYHVAKNLRASFAYYILCILLLLFALYSKQNAATIPIVFLLIEILFIRKENGKIAKVYVITLSSVLLFIGLFVILGGYLPTENDFIRREQYFGSQQFVIFRYIKLLFLPVSLNFDPDIRLSDNLFGFMEIILMLGHLIIILAGVILYKRNKLITFGIFWFYITLLVESSIIPIRDLMFEHRLYLPSFGFIIIITTLIFSFLINKIKMRFVILVFIFTSVTLGGMSYNRNKVWENDFTLWTDVVEKSPEKARPHRYLGAEYVYRHDYKRALAEFDKSIQIDPRWQEHDNKANIYRKIKDYKSAIKELDHCIELKPEKATFYNDRAEMKMRIGQYDAAKKDLNKAIKRDSEFDIAFFNTGNYFLYKKDYESAIAYFSKAISNNSVYSAAFNNRGEAKLRLNQIEESIHDFTKAIQINSKFDRAYFNRGSAYFFLKNYDMAIIDYDQTIQLNAKYGKAYRGRGMSYYSMGNYDRALEDLKKAIALGEQINSKIIEQIENNFINNSKEID